MRFYCIIILLLPLFTCKNKSESNSPAQQTTSIPDSTFDKEKYNLEIRTDTSIKCPILIGREIDKVIVNQPYYLDTTDFIRFFSAKGMNHRYRSLWTCNVPDLINPGDTVLLSGICYSVAGDERMPGIPFVISRILLHDNYEKRLSNRLNVDE